MGRDIIRERREGVCSYHGYSGRTTGVCNKLCPTNMVNEVFILAVKVQNTYWSGKKPFPSPSPALTGVVSYDCRSHGTWYLHTANTALTLSSRQNYIIHQSTFSN